MAETKIEWTATPRPDGSMAPGYTFNPWEGCTKVSAGCANCYAETRAERFGSVKWGPQGTRRVASENYWRQPLKWDREAREAGQRRRVFCASLADAFEDWQGPMMCSKTGEPLSVNAAGHVWPMGWPSLSDGDDWGARDYTMHDARRRLFDLIDRTPSLDWLLLTKRPENILRMMPPRDLGEPDQADVASGMDPESPWRRPNVWLGTSVEDQATADERIPHLLKIPAVVRFLSIEPLLGPVDLTSIDIGHDCHTINCLTGRDTVDDQVGPRVDWVICGSESGFGARPCDLAWVRFLRDQCVSAGVPFFWKQHVQNGLKISLPALDGKRWAEFPEVRQ